MTIDAVSLAPTSTAAPTASDPLSSPLHQTTPLLHSPHLSSRTGHNVYLKLDCDQPSGSFKIRGIGAICQQAISTYGAAGTHLVSSSGGNAGLAVAYAASRAGVACTIYVPVTTEEEVVERLRGEGARVVVGGEAWDAADAAARAEVERMRELGGKGAVYVHPFEGEALVEGHSGLVDEVYAQLPSIDVLISSVGGGGLLRGIIKGVERQAGPPPTLVAVQNFGVDSFNRSIDHYSTNPTPSLPNDVVALHAIESKCTSMGTKKCSLTTLHDAISYSRNGEIITLTVTDDLSASACWQFSAHSESDLGAERMVELSCASALTPVFHPWILERIVEGSEKLQGKVRENGRLNVVVEVCGGSKVSKGLLEGYKVEAGLMERRDRVRVSGVDYPAST